MTLRVCADGRRLLLDMRVAGEESVETRAAFTKKWRLQFPAVIASLEEAGNELFAVLGFPVAEWRAFAYDECGNRHAASPSTVPFALIA